MVELSQVEQHTYAAHCKHKDQKHGLFCGTRHVTLHLLHTWVAITLKHSWHIEAIQEVLAGQEADLQRIAEHNLDDVKPGDAFLPSHFSTLVCLRESPGTIGDLLDLQAVVVLFTAVGVHQYAIDVARVKLACVMVMMATVVTTVTVVIHVRMQEGVASVTLFCRLVNRIRDEAQAGRAHQDDLKDPVADVRDWEGLVITSLVAARLHGVTDEHDLLILINLLSHYAYYQDTENHHHCQQDPPNHGRVLLDSRLEQPLQDGPFSHGDGKVADLSEETGLREPTPLPPADSFFYLAGPACALVDLPVSGGVHPTPVPHQLPFDLYTLTWPLVSAPLTVYVCVCE